MECVRRGEQSRMGRGSGAAIPHSGDRAMMSGEAFGAPADNVPTADLTRTSFYSQHCPPGSAHAEDSCVV